MLRRDFLKYSALGSLYPMVAGCDQSAKWGRAAFRKKDSSRVAILSAARYDQPLRDTIIRGIKVCGLEVRGKRILLKPNLVEFDPKGVINTHPAVVEAAIDSFRSLGAAQVVVAEGPGHRRDNEYLLSASGLYDVIKEHRVRYVDLNSDDVRSTPLRSSFTDLKQLYLPETLYNADLLVSMPKLKTHHWAGVTLSLKNMFGVVPGRFMDGRKIFFIGKASTRAFSTSTARCHCRSLPLSTALSAWKAMALFRVEPRTAACSFLAMTSSRSMRPRPE